MLHLWLGLLTALVLGLGAFAVLAAVKARRHRMAADARMDELGRQIAGQADALHRRCDHLLGKVERLEALADRVRLLELERQVARLAGRGQLSAEAAQRLDAAVADLQADAATATKES